MSDDFANKVGDRQNSTSQVEASIRAMLSKVSFELCFVCASKLAAQIRSQIHFQAMKATRPEAIYPGIYKMVAHEG